jgi:hypothetical protein
LSFDELLALPGPCEFSVDHYEFILRRALHLGYHFATHHDHAVKRQTPEPYILLRHDIDFSIKKALPLLKIEKALGICSTLFIRAHSCGYNPFDIDNYAILTDLKQNGFEIALHYEPLFMLLTREDPLILLKRAKKFLEAAIDIPIFGFISHAPRLSQQLYNINEQKLKNLGFLYNGADPLFTWKSFYLSDANRRWRRGCACSHIGKQRRITLLIHPCWWQPMSQGMKYEAIEYLRQGR